MRVRILTGLLPLAVACATISPPSATHFAVPFDFVRNQIVLDIRVADGTPLRVLLDTAGSPSAVDLETAERIGLPLDRGASGDVEGVGSQRATMYASRLVNVKLGDHRLPDLDAVALDLSLIAERFGQPIDGILGQGFLAGRIVQIDYPGRTIRFFDDPVTARRVAARRGDDVYVTPLVVPPGEIAPLVEVSIDGTTIQATLDTGSSLGLELDPEAASEIGLEVDRGLSNSDSVIGARGAASVSTTRAGEIAIGAYRWRSHTVTLRPMGEGARRGNLGNALLRTFVVTVDDVSDSLRFTQPRSR